MKIIQGSTITYKIIFFYYYFFIFLKPNNLFWAIFALNILWWILIKNKWVWGMMRTWITIHIWKTLPRIVMRRIFIFIILTICNAIYLINIASLIIILFSKSIFEIVFFAEFIGFALICLLLFRLDFLQILIVYVFLELRRIISGWTILFVLTIFILYSFLLFHGRLGYLFWREAGFVRFRRFSKTILLLLILIFT